MERRKYLKATVNKDLIIKISLYAFFLFWLVIFLTPVFWMISSSFKSSEEILKPVIEWIPEKLRFENYVFVWKGKNYQRYFLNSLIVATSATISNLFVASLAGYGFAKFSFPGKRLFFMFILTTIMIPFQVIVIPLYILIRSFGWINTYLGLIAPGAVTAFGVFLVRQSIMTIPDTLCDAARIDGCSEFRIYWNIVLPLCKPALATLAILTLLHSWNNLLWPLLVAHSEEVKTLPLAITELTGSEEYGYQYGKLMSAATIMSMPVMIVFLFFQKYFVRGIVISGIKG